MTDKFKAQWRALIAILFTAACIFINPVASVAADAANTPFTVKIIRTDKFGDDLHVGDVLTFEIKYTNNTKQNISIFPGETNIEGVRPPEGKSNGGCIWRNLRPNQTAACNIGSYTVTAEDINGISFISKWKGTADSQGRKPLVNGTDISAATLPDPIAKVNPEPRPTPPYNPPPLTAADDDASRGVPALKAGQKVTLSTENYAGFKCHRIPALTVAPNGDILAAWDGRPNTCQDAPNPNSIIQRRSTDGGKTWAKPTYIAAGKKEAPKFGYSDPSYVVDREKGKIFAFFVKSFDHGFGTAQAGLTPTKRDVLHAAVTESSDNGVTWSQPRIITKDINVPNGYVRFAASGEGIQIREGKHKGRLAQQYTFRIGTPSSYKQQAVSVYSDDHGITWKAGTPVGTGMDENKVVELAGGKLMLNSRTSDSNKARKVAYSDDGGQTWSEVKVDHNLVDPRNNASIIRAFPLAPANDPKSQVLLFSNANNANGRSNGTISVSFDNGKTWPVKKTFEPGGMQYSTLTPLEYKGKEWAGKYGLLSESPVPNIVYEMIDLKWLGLRDDLTFERCNPIDAPAASLTLDSTNLPQQDTEGRANMLDGNLSTIWHSPWYSSISLPTTIEFSVKNGPVSAEKLILHHRTDSSNGRFKNFTVKGGVGDQLKTLGTYTNNPNDGKPTIIKLTEPISKIQITVNDTYGDNPRLKFASLAEIQLTKTAFPTGCSKVTVNGGKISSEINDAAMAHEGDKVRVTPTIPEGKRFTGWTVEPAGIALTANNDGSSSFVMPNTAVTLTANFAPIKQDPPSDPGKTNPGKTNPDQTDPGKTNPDKTNPGQTDPAPTPGTPQLNPPADQQNGNNSILPPVVKPTPTEPSLAGTGAALLGLSIFALLLIAVGGVAFYVRQRNSK